MKDQPEFYEIEYDACPMPGVGKFVLKSQKVEPPVRDEIRELFYRMRDIAHDYRPGFYSSNKFYDKRVQRENARLFYKQGIFMQSFTDQYDKVVPYSSYFPNYQGMGYEQLRTYFTWRTGVRQGEVTDISLSYAYLYIYELLSNIGVEEPKEGMQKLIDFWQTFREYDCSLDRYVIRWVKDYYIYYDMPGTFREFTEQYGLEDYYPKIPEGEDRFALYCEISKYDIRKSKFYSEENKQLIQTCFEDLLDRLGQVFKEQGIPLEDSVFRPLGKLSIWEPFRGALFYDWKNQRDRKVVLSTKEIYICSGNHWSFSNVITSESGKKLIGYMMKQMESVLRRLTGYRHKLQADLGSVTHEIVSLLAEKEISLEQLVTETVTASYREATKTVVRVNAEQLSRIRQEALLTQEKLTVPEDEEFIFGGQEDFKEQPEAAGEAGLTHYQQQTLEFALQPDTLTSEDAGIDSPWAALKEALSAMELQTLSLICKEAGGKGQPGVGCIDVVSQFALEQGIMPEVLMDGINEKAFDYVGDSLTDDAFAVYEDYIEDVRKMVEGI